ncbi:antimicrobial peptide system protein, SdpA family [Melghirimyces algeriensis]|uniref:Antimicrobial peptide system protein, SdpA family n=2 Tax=Melghirimyces algeriensis TaxID=910412 RepID=A0A521DG24_9BACL|nr:antimicrobial peptide system protein, SdpA family [Melghirimyces algeriensis]
MGAIFQLIPKKEWVKCKDNADLHSCSSKTREFHVINPAPTPLLCGEYYFTKEEISPWSYSKYSDPIEKITEMVKVDVKCIKK